VKAAVMCEDVAATVYLASTLGDVSELAADQVDALHQRYQTQYGQRPGKRSGKSTTNKPSLCPPDSRIVGSER
jgi:L-ribulose-5-phosphate 4-epimerase